MLVETAIYLNTVAPRYNEQHLKARQNYSKICGNKPRYNELILTVPMHNLPLYNEYFVLSALVLSKIDMMIRMVDKPNTTPIGQDRVTLTFKALLYN